MSRPKLLDLFCGGGGASMGYHRAGFQVVGVDINPSPRYPYQAIQMRAEHYLADAEWIADRFDAVHASPPCQAFTAYRRKGHGVGDGYPNLIPEIRRLLDLTGLPYVVENVEQAREHLREPVMLCGSMFGLDVRRHRLFETNWPLGQPACNHAAQVARGKQFPGATNREGRYTCEVGVWRIPLDVQRRAMGIDWMELAELSEALPPAYTEYVGHELLAQLELVEEVAA